MAGIYVHMSGKDSDEAILRANNIEVTQIKKDPALKPYICAKCKTINPATNRFCNSCGFILDNSTAEGILKEQTQGTDASKILYKVLQDTEVIELLKKKMKEIQVEGVLV